MAGKSVLIVDDSLIISERLQAMLKELDNIGAIARAGDYVMGLQRLMDTPFDIVLLDINLPGKTGIELLRYIKANFPDTIVIMLTNQSGQYYRDLCNRMGADYFMDKSNEFEVVPVVISWLV
jgi:DNA-binding NarL/FixJ family response regulator